MSAINEVTKDDLLQLAVVVTAAAEGKTIQVKYKETNDPWLEKISLGHWDPEYCNYRVQPEPREFWITEKSGCLLAYYSEEGAQRDTAKDTYIKIIQVKEVYDDE